MNIIRAKDYDDLSVKAAQIISSQITLKPDSVLGLATGSSPVGTYKRLIAMYEEGLIDFSKIKSVNLDEYVGLSGEHDQSYRYFMNSNLFNYVNIKKENTNVPNGLAKDPEAECKRYDEVIRSMGQIDMQLLGIGGNGHIGFNEPDTAFAKGTHVVTLKEETRKANSRFFASIDEVPTKALTMGVGSIMSAKSIILVANGEGKAKAIHDTVLGPVTPEVPASILQLHPNVYIVADEAALSLVPADML